MSIPELKACKKSQKPKCHLGQDGITVQKTPQPTEMPETDLSPLIGPLGVQPRSNIHRRQLLKE